LKQGRKALPCAGSGSVSNIPAVQLILLQTSGSNQGGGVCCGWGKGRARGNRGPNQQPLGSLSSKEGKAASAEY